MTPADFCQNAVTVNFKDFKTSVLRLSVIVTLLFIQLQIISDSRLT